MKRSKEVVRGAKQHATVGPCYCCCADLVWCYGIGERNTFELDVTHDSPTRLAQSAITNRDSRRESHPSAAVAKRHGETSVENNTPTPHLHPPRGDPVLTLALMEHGQHAAPSLHTLPHFGDGVRNPTDTVNELECQQGDANQEADLRHTLPKARRVSERSLSTYSRARHRG